MTVKSSPTLMHQDSGEDAIKSAFERARAEGRGALIGYLTAGDPSPKHTPTLCRALIEGGVDILELGIPFSDPIADGPTIQAASVRALESKTTPSDCLEIAKQIKQDSLAIRNEPVPMIFLTYYNSIFRFGLDSFSSKARAAGIDGIVVPDLPQLGSAEFSRYTCAERKNQLATILLATPTTTEERLHSILAETRGFLYLVSLLGVTGVKRGNERSSSASADFIRRTCEVAHKRASMPVAVGFGISQPAHVQRVLNSGADGAIVGSAFVNIVAENLHDIDKASKDLKEFTQSLQKATYMHRSMP